MFLMGLIEPGSQRRCWITPGGAIDPGEDPFSALRRETMEELGLHLSESDIGAAIWRRRATFSWDGEETDQEETYFLIETSRFEPVRCFDGDAETTYYSGEPRWWTTEELRGTAEHVVPEQLPALLDQLRSDGPPPTPIDITKAGYPRR